MNVVGSAHFVCEGGGLVSSRAGDVTRIGLPNLSSSPTSLADPADSQPRSRAEKRSKQETKPAQLCKESPVTTRSPMPA